ncbi:hypothetical protein FG05_35024 [Fusarium graminearum]|nr:hypothetical protein FG05_35024 [Fusarium graminearum]
MGSRLTELGYSVNYTTAHSLSLSLKDNYNYK